MVAPLFLRIIERVVRPRKQSMMPDARWIRRAQFKRIREGVRHVKAETKLQIWLNQILFQGPLTKLQWKKVAHQMKTDYFYSWRQCRAKYKAVLKEERTLACAKPLSSANKRPLGLNESVDECWRLRRDLWRRGASRRQEEAKSQDAQLEGRFEHKIPLQVLSSLERSRPEDPSALLKYVARVWSEEAWDEETMKQFGRTCLYGYNILSFVSTEMHYDLG